jgi:hypothetical protein
MAQYRGLTEIKERMRWKSKSTPLRRHLLDDFPVYREWTKRGLIWVTSDELIVLWEQSKVQMDQGSRLKRPRRPRRKPDYKPYNWRLRYKNRTPTGTIGPAPIEEKRVDLPREELPVQIESRREPLPGPPVNQPTPSTRTGMQRPEGCVCGTGLDCDAHGEPA